MTRLIAIALLAGFASPVAAQDVPMAPTAAPVCPKDAEPIPPALAGWSVRKPLVAATDAASLPTALATPGTAYDLALAPASTLTYTVQPARPVASTSHGGLVGFSIAEKGTYRIAIGSGAWLDVVRDGASLRSTGHGHGPACSGIRKMVDFALEPGAYTLQIVGNDTASLAMLITRMN